MKTTLIIQNLKCEGCAQTIITRLSEVKGINDVIVDIDNSSVHFDHYTVNSFFSAKNKLKSLGYPAEGEINSVVTRAKSFVSCASGKLSKN